MSTQAHSEFPGPGPGVAPRRCYNLAVTPKRLRVESIRHPNLFEMDKPSICVSMRPSSRRLKFTVPITGHCPHQQ
jgi:hypothetical protein